MTRLLSPLVLVALLVSASPVQALEPRHYPMEPTQVRFWGYQIQGLSRDGAVEELVSSRYDLLVIEPTRTDWSSDDREFDTRTAVGRIRNSPASDMEHRKLVLAYIDIGQAEDWRWYWTWQRPDFDDPDFSGLPGFFAAPDPDGWDGNYVVYYWDPEWRAIVLGGDGREAAPGRDYTSIMDEVLKDGFDGVYLDWVEAFENEAVIQRAEKLGLDPAREMVRLIRDIAEYGRSRNPDFIVIQQNGSALARLAPEILEVVDGIAQEGIWFEGVATDDWDDPEGADMPVDPVLTSEYLTMLARYQEAGLTVLDCEYALEHAEEAYRLSLGAGFVPYATRRSLGRLTTTPPPGYGR